MAVSVYVFQIPKDPEEGKIIPTKKLLCLGQLCHVRRHLKNESPCNSKTTSVSPSATSTHAPLGNTNLHSSILQQCYFALNYCVMWVIYKHSTRIACWMSHVLVRLMG